MSGRVFVATCGLSPQVITESIYALAIKLEPAFFPTSLRIITTSEGRDKVLDRLSSHGEGWLLRLCEEYGLPALDITDQDIVVPPAIQAGGTGLEDIRTSEDNIAASDTISDLIRELTAEEDSEVHASIAGGRKTMGYLLGYSLSLFGREQDALSHVLVSPEFESIDGFYYPTKKQSFIKTRSGELLDASKAEVDLALLPFVRMRSSIPKSLLSGKASFSATVSAIAIKSSSLEVSIDPGARSLQVGDVSTSLTPIQLVFFSTLIRLTAQKKELLFPKKNLYDKELGAFLIEEAKRLELHSALHKDTVLRMSQGVDSSYLYTLLSRLRKVLLESYGAETTERLIKEKKSGVGVKLVSFGSDPSNVRYLKLAHEAC